LLRNAVKNSIPYFELKEFQCINYSSYEDHLNKYMFHSSNECIHPSYDAFFTHHIPCVNGRFYISSSSESNSSSAVVGGGTTDCVSVPALPPLRRNWTLRMRKCKNVHSRRECDEWKMHHMMGECIHSMSETCIY
jgi:hypothetical protein